MIAGTWNSKFYRFLCADCVEILGLYKPPGLIWTCPGLNRESFTFTSKGGLNVISDVEETPVLNSQRQVLKYDHYNCSVKKITLHEFRLRCLAAVQALRVLSFSMVACNSRS